MDRRQFLAAVSVSGVALGQDRPALMGGTPVRKEPFPSWPVIDATEERALTGVLRSRKWFRMDGQAVNRFESAYARLTGAKYCLATANGTSALLTSLAALGVGAGQEVIVPPYTFVATVNAVLALNALPVFVDSDPETFQIDARKIEAAITGRTAAILPVHLGGSAADLDTILAVAARRKLPVVEDACQAHLAEWRGRKVGSLGTTGCFSFQASKNLNSGEGGAILTSDEALLDRCFAFHNNGRGRKTAGYDFSYRAGGLNLRMTEFQAALLEAQMTRIETQARTREGNARYLSGMLGEIPGVRPAALYPGCTRNAYHLYMFRYRKEQFANLPRARFIEALTAEGVPASSGYSPLNKEAFLAQAFQARSYQALYPAETLAHWRERNDCPANDRLCEEAVWFTQNMLLGPRTDMDQIAAAVRKIHAHAAELAG
ncbi:MAG TPA: DegT/DnrJ/EryC1/StrS family aminotransferase [Bryobacteraceae bacterium]|nr:DegT/DnrJ/EryC1/StrS family aminotransferase [Bryobacteraceae bacterium]